MSCAADWEESDDVEAGRALFAELLPTAPIDLFDRVSDDVRDWYIEEAQRRKTSE